MMLFSFFKKKRAENLGILPLAPWKRGQWHLSTLLYIRTVFILPRDSVLYNHKVITTMTTFRLNMILTQPLEIPKFAGLHWSRSDKVSFPLRDLFLF